MEGLSPAEQEIARELSRLAADPSPASRDSIMRAVRAGRQAQARRPGGGLRWRLIAVVAATLLLLVGGTSGAVAASSQALPHNPAYTLRFVNEKVRLTVANPVGRVELRIDFARDRFRQAQLVVRENRSDAMRLIDDGRVYLDQARRDLSSLPAGEQGRMENPLNQAGQDQKAAENQLNQYGEQGQH
ncbi:MAG: anti-sigma factor [Candidatus Dormibacteraeota bacterium]|nr:anti-sigma factor [Candidatus Dormibacteraeota bacterium]